MMRKSLVTSSWLVLLACGCGQVVGEPVKGGTAGGSSGRGGGAGGGGSAGFGPYGTPCDKSECKESTLAFTKGCPNGQELSQECVSTGAGTCYWRWPACPAEGAGGAGGKNSGSGGGGRSGTAGTPIGSGGTDHPGEGSCPGNLMTFRARKAPGLTQSTCLKSDCFGRWLTILDSQGVEIATRHDCMPSCGDCSVAGCMASCLPMGELSSTGASTDATWDGTYFTESTCTWESDSVACAVEHCANKGRYTARACSFKNPNPLSPNGCAESPTESISCVEVPFDFPPVASLVDITFGAGEATDAGGVDGDRTRDAQAGGGEDGAKDARAPDALVEASPGDACRDAIALHCGDRLDHSTLVQGRANEWYGYSRSQRWEGGRESVYVLQTSGACQVEARLENLTVDLDLFLLTACESMANTEASSTPLDLQTIERISFTTAAAKSYWVVVDGYGDDAGSYTLKVDCTCN